MIVAAPSRTKKTPFHTFHVDAGAKLVQFAGYEMPIQYKGMISEHLAVRENVGLFDLSHMGEFMVSGGGALSFLQKVTTNNVALLTPGKIQYSCMTYPLGGIVDDLLVYCLDKSYMLVVNASNIAKDFDWLSSQSQENVTVTNVSDEYGLLAIQGPRAEKVMARLTDYDLASMLYYTSATAAIEGEEILFSRTGYTGEDGFELYIPKKKCAKLWKAVSAAGKEFGMELIGLGARDSLRLEMKMALYGNDIDADTTPIEAGLGWIVDLNKDFIGRDTLAKQKEEKPLRRLVCLEMEGKVFPRTGYMVTEAGTPIGKVTSGTFSPSLKKPIALAYVSADYAKIGTVVSVDVRGTHVPATVTKPPFYKQGSHK